ncbi:unnamed protein product [Menidia menidia]|uniref:(Atlantic silverside) hypothetical protein n=1 Tax=Menidia menidia TaxID=238744 RepID=A0A8S4BJ42_9TELE|nr:unnamed protein product [Menidia menidia]
MRTNSFIFTGKSGKAANTDSLNDQHENQEEGGVSSGEAAAASGTAEMPSDSDNGSSSADAGPTRGSDTYDEASEIKAVLSEIQELWENQGKLKESFKNLRATYQQRNTEILEALQEEQFR